MRSKAHYIWGTHVVETLLEQHPEAIIKVSLAENIHKRLGGLKHQLQDMDIPVEVLAKSVLDQLSGNGNHQGIVAQVEPPKPLSEGDLINRLEAKAQPLIIILDEIQDPQNLGAILRSASAFGVDAVVAPTKHACPMTPAVRKVASGGDLMVPYVQVTNLSRFIANIKKMGIWVVGTLLDEEATSITEVDFKGPCAIVLGSEGQGMRHKTEEHCDFKAFIPMSPAMESLNVSVACGICLYECSRQRNSIKTT